MSDDAGWSIMEFIVWEGVCRQWVWTRGIQTCERWICMEDSRYFPLVVGVVGIQGFLLSTQPMRVFRFFFNSVRIADDGCHWWMSSSGLARNRHTWLVVLLSRSTHRPQAIWTSRQEANTNEWMNESIKPQSTNRRKRQVVMSTICDGDPGTNGSRSERTTSIRVILPINSFPVFRFSTKVLGDQSVMVESCGTENSLCLPACLPCLPDRWENNMTPRTLKNSVDIPSNASSPNENTRQGECYTRQTMAVPFVVWKRKRR